MVRSSKTSPLRRLPTLRIPRPLQILLVLLGVQVVSRLWPDPPKPELAAEIAPDALLGVWVGTERDLAVHFGQVLATVRFGDRVEQVRYTITGRDGDALQLTLEHEPPELRSVCVYGDRIDLACPSGVWAARPVDSQPTGLPRASDALVGRFVHDANRGEHAWSIGVVFADHAVSREWNGTLTGTDRCELVDDSPSSALLRCVGEDGTVTRQRWRVDPDGLTELASGLRYRRVP